MSDDRGEIVGPRGIVRRRPSTGAARYSLCTMVTRWDEWQRSSDRFRAKGFGDADCEYLTIDNSRGNVADAYQAVNEFLQSASGTYVVLVHHDVLLLDDGRTELDARLDELTRLDPAWGLCGNAGHDRDGWPAICISHPYRDRHVAGGPFPAPVVSLDENFIVVRREANLAASRDLAGYHHYGADLCTVADILGWNAWVVGFYLRHDSGGTIDASYERSHRAIAAKYARAFRPRWVPLITRRSFFVSGRRGEAAVARWLRYAGKLVGLVPRHHHLDDERRLARQAQRRARREG